MKRAAYDYARTRRRSVSAYVDWNKGSATRVWLEKWASDRAVGEQDASSSARVRERRDGSLKISRVLHIARGDEVCICRVQ